MNLNKWIDKIGILIIDLHICSFGRSKSLPQVFPRQKMPKATFSQPHMCMKKTNWCLNCVWPGQLIYLIQNCRPKCILILFYFHLKFQTDRFFVKQKQKIITKLVVWTLDIIFQMMKFLTRSQLPIRTRYYKRLTFFCQMAAGKELFKIEQYPYLCWKLNPRTPAYHKTQRCSSLCSTKHVKSFAIRQYSVNSASLEKSSSQTLLRGNARPHHAFYWCY